MQYSIVVYDRCTYCDSFAYEYKEFNGSSIFRWYKQKQIRNEIIIHKNDYSKDRLIEGFAVDIYDTEFDIVNAWYKPYRNSITIPPGILVPPIFHGENDSVNKRVNYVYLASILAHEIGHSIDVHGLLFDEKGNYRVPYDESLEKSSTSDDNNNNNNNNKDEELKYHLVFSKDDIEKFTELTACLAKDFGKPCNRSDYGKNTLGEDMADQIGVYVSYHFFKNELLGMCSEFAGINRSEKCVKSFYLDYATIWCSQLSEKQKCNLVERDVHALPADRVDKTLRQMQSFQKVFKCNYDDKMVNNNKCFIY